MVNIKLIRESNQGVKALPPHLVAVFIGATSGIAEAGLRQFVRDAREPTVYVVGRNAARAAQLLADLRQSNAKAVIEFVEKDASLIRDIDAACAVIKAKQRKVDLLFLSAGFISFNGRQETKEALDASMSTRYYVRMRAIQQLLPLLNAAPSPRVVSVLAGGREGKMVEDDLDLRKPANYSIPNAATHSVTMGTLALRRFAVENPAISFVHTFPGFVATDNLAKGSTGLVKLLLTWIVHPFVNTFVATRVEDAGARMVFYGTSARYAVTEGSGIPLPAGVEKAAPVQNGLFLADATSDITGNAALLADFENRGVGNKVWAFTNEIFSGVEATAGAA